MWDNNDKVWEHHEGILATDHYTAKLLHNYLRLIRINKPHANSMEIIDLQEYKIVRNQRKVTQAINFPNQLEPFVFLQNLN